MEGKYDYPGIMRGLKTQEATTFKRFFQLIQDAAAARDSVFFAFSGEGNDIILPGMEGEDMTGWLIPSDKVTEFEPEWNESADLDHLERWGDYFLWAEWQLVNGEIKIEFKRYS